MQLLETDGDLARGLALLTDRWHPLILHPPTWSVEILPGEMDAWCYRDHSSEIETALAFLDGLRQVVGSRTLLAWKLERLLENYRFSPTQYWRFRAELLLECWRAEPHSIGDLLEGRTLGVVRRPFVLIYKQGLELWSLPPRPPMRFCEAETSAEIA
jgi:hypothetical protein